MTATSKESASYREILLVGPHDMLGTGAIDAMCRLPGLARHNSSAPIRADISHLDSAQTHWCLPHGS
jgi:hypothetical protein